MRFYLIDFDLLELVEDTESLDWQALKQSLPRRPSWLLDRPFLHDAAGNCLIDNGENRDWVEARATVAAYPHGQSEFERKSNAINLLDYRSDKKSRKHDKDHLRWAEDFLQDGLSLSLLLSRKLAGEETGRFRVIFSYFIGRSVNGVIHIHRIREEDSFDVLKNAIVEGVLTIE